MATRNVVPVANEILKQSLFGEMPELLRHTINHKCNGSGDEEFTPAFLREVMVSRAFLRAARRQGLVRKTIDRYGSSSYGWKHVIERLYPWGQAQYVGNDAFILAAHIEGLKMVNVSWDSPSVLLNLSKKTHRLVTYDDMAAELSMLMVEKLDGHDPFYGTEICDGTRN